MIPAFPLGEGGCPKGKRMRGARWAHTPSVKNQRFFRESKNPQTVKKKLRIGADAHIGPQNLFPGEKVTKTFDF